MRLTLPACLHVKHLAPLLLTFSLIAAAQAQEANTLEIKGELVRAMRLTIQEFARLPQKNISESRHLDSQGGKTSAQVSYQGVLLKDVLAAADLKEGQRHDFRKMLILAKASDGYQALFT